MTTMTLETMDNLILEYKELQEAMRKKLADGLKDVLNNYFELDPEIKTIRWNQFTPYFNDGGPCEFSVNDIYFSNAAPDQLSSWGDLDNDGDDDALFSESYYGDRIKEKDSKKALRARIAKLLHEEQMQDVLLATFGDHVYVTITRDEMTAEEFEHD